MRKRIDGFLLLLFPCVLFFSGKTKQEHYIIFKYVYDIRERPVPAMIFYTDTFEVSDPYMLFNKYDFKLNNKELQSLENVIKKESAYLLIDTLAPAYYSFKIANGCESKFYGTVNLTQTKKIFDEALNKLSTRSDFLEIKKAFDWVSTFLKPAGASN